MNGGGTYLDCQVSPWDGIWCFSTICSILSKRRCEGFVMEVIKLSFMAIFFSLDCYIYVLFFGSQTIKFLGGLLLSWILLLVV